jgi:hypothetical protein
MIATTCAVCGTSFKAERSTARYCSPACRKVAFLVRDHPLQDAGTLSEVQSLGDSVPASPPRHGGAPDGLEIVFGPAALHGDTIPGRKWRVVMVDAGYRLDCEAMVPGGWKLVATKPTMLELRRLAAWMGLTLTVDITLTAGRSDAKSQAEEPAEIMST